MLALVDGVVDHGSYARQHTSSSFLSTWSSCHANDPTLEDKLKHKEDLIKNLMQSQQYILSILHVIVSICAIY
jgi:hypothetical protein